MKVPMELTNAIDRYGHGKIGVAYTTENGYIQSEFFEYENDLFEYLEKVFGDIELFAYGLYVSFDDYFGYTVFYLDDEVEDSIGYCAQAVNKIEHKPKQIIFNIVY